MQGISKSLCAAAGVLALSGCSSTKPLSAAGIDYRLPRTDATVTLDLKLLDCTPIALESELKIVAKAGADTPFFHLDGAKLSSARIKRELKLSVSDDRVLTAINTVNADQTPAIVGNYVKAILTVAAVALASPCKPEVIAALNRVVVLKKQILALRQQLAAAAGPTPSAQDLKYIRETNTLARELASLQEGVLHLELTGDLKFDDEKLAASPRPVSLKAQPLQQWFTSSAGSFDPGLEWTATAVPMTVRDALTDHSSKSKRARECRLSIKVPSTRQVKVEVKSRSGSVHNPPLQSVATMPVAQWSEPAELCLDVGVGESRSVSLVFDKFGQTKEFSWATEAQAAGAAAALPGIATDAMALRQSILGPSALERQKAEIDQLETQQKLNKLRACRAILDAGGFSCDESAE